MILAAYGELAWPRVVNPSCKNSTHVKVTRTGQFAFLVLHRLNQQDSGRLGARSASALQRCCVVVIDQRIFFRISVTWRSRAVAGSRSDLGNFPMTSREFNDLVHAHYDVRRLDDVSDATVTCPFRSLRKGSISCCRFVVSFKKRYVLRTNFRRWVKSLGESCLMTLGDE